MNKDVLIIGNGVSRLNSMPFVKKWKNEIWGCNWIFKHIQNLPQLNRIGAVNNNENVLDEMYMFKTKNNCLFDIYSLKYYTEYDNKVFDDPIGWCTGNSLIRQAYKENFDRIVLIGFDFGGSDVYKDYNLYGGNFINQFVQICDNYDTKKIYYVGERKPFFEGFDLNILHNLNDFYNYI